MMNLIFFTIKTRFWFCQETTFLSSLILLQLNHTVRSTSTLLSSVKPFSSLSLLIDSQVTLDEMHAVIYFLEKSNEDARS